MPIIYLHGVANRDENGYPQLEHLLRRYISDELKQPNIEGDVPIIPIYWGDVGIGFAWDRQSCPHVGLFQMGHDEGLSIEQRAQLLANLSKELRDLPMASSTSGGLLAPGSITSATSALRLKDFTETQLSDISTAIIQTKLVDIRQLTIAAIAADEVAHDPTILTRLASEPDLDAELTLLQSLIEQRYNQLELQQSSLMLQGPGWFGDLSDRLREALSRSDQSSGYALTRVLSQFRTKLNDAFTLFFGDLFTYLANRGNPTQPGEIMQRLLNGLTKAHTLQQERGGEPIVVLSHSMGGQIMYDALTYFLPNMPEYQDIRVDFWCATASQVGLFEEMKLFAASDPKYGIKKGNRVPLPGSRYLGHWWNVWDANDFLSFTAKPVFINLDDYRYESGMSILQAHSGYLERPSFYRVFAKRLATSRQQNWNRL